MMSEVDTILLPRFSTKNMTTKKGKKPRKISSTTARQLLSWKHHHFRKTLQDKACMLGKEVVIVGEHLTTQACGACGALNSNIGK